MNLYIFNETRRGAVYGIGTYIRELTSALKDSDINVYVVNLISDKPQLQKDDIDGIRYWYFPSPIQEQWMTNKQRQKELYLRNVVYLLKLHIKDKKDLIFHLNFDLSIKLTDELKKKFDCKIIASVHYFDWGFTIFDNLPRLRNMLNERQLNSFDKNLKKNIEEEKSLYSKMDSIICLSNYMQDILCRDYGVDLSKIVVIPNGLTDAVETRHGVQHLRKRWNVPANEKIILFAGRMDEIKGLIYVIRAFREVLKSVSCCRLMIAGDGNYDTYLKESKDIYTKITFTGLLEKKNLYELYKIADVGVIASLFEPFGYVAVEMMMHSLPIIATATSGLNEVIDDSCGLKVPIIRHPDRIEIDTVLLAEKIIYMLQHHIEAKKIGQNGRKKYLKKYSLETFRSNMLRLYKKT